MRPSVRVVAAIGSTLLAAGLFGCSNVVSQDIEALFASHGYVVRVANGMSAPQSVRDPVADADGTGEPWQWVQVVSQPFGEAVAFVQVRAGQAANGPGRFGYSGAGPWRCGVWLPDSGKDLVVFESDNPIEIAWWYLEGNRFLVHAQLEPNSETKRKWRHHFSGEYYEVAADDDDGWHYSDVSSPDVEHPRSRDVGFPVWLVTEKAGLLREPWLSGDGKWLFELRRTGDFRNKIWLSGWQLSTMRRVNFLRLK